MKKRVLLLGANGQLGSFLQLALAADFELVAVTRAEIDLALPTHVAEQVKAFSPDIVVNAAAYTAVDQAQTDSENAFYINRDAVAAIATACAELNAVFVHVSTDYVFSGEAEMPYLETDSIGPQSVYGQSKLAGEEQALQRCRKTIIIRTSWVFSENGQNFVKTIFGLSTRLPKLEVVADQVGGPTYAGDLANFLVVVVKASLAESFNDWGVFHYGGQPHVSWYEFACAICQMAGSAIPVEPVSSAKFIRPAPRPKNSRLDCNKAAQVFGVNPPDWRPALAAVLAKIT